MSDYLRLSAFAGVFATASALFACAAEPSSGTLQVLTYNVAGLPQGLSGSEPVRNIPQMSPLLNAYDLALVQEDFWYHAELAAHATHAFISTPWRERPNPTDVGDGLNTFSRTPFEGFERVGWGDCNGGINSCAGDCFATEGFTFARHRLAPGIELDVYNLHMEAGSCDRDREIRDASGFLSV